MAVTIAELISKKDDIKKNKASRYELETSIGDIVIKLPTSKIIADAWQFSDSVEGNKYLIRECTVSPDLKSKELLDAYEVADPMDIVPAIFQVGEISRIASVILDLAGFNGSIKSKLVGEIKNS